MQDKGLTSSAYGSKAYETLRFEVNQVLVQGRAQMEREKVQTYWKSGRLIVTYFEKHPDERKRGHLLIKKLAEDLGVHFSVVHRIVKFATYFPKLARGQVLTWSHYRVLIGVTSNEIREQLEREALTETWTAETLRQEIKTRFPKKGGVQVLPPSEKPELKPRLGEFQTYFIKEIEGEKMLDLGFQTYRPLSKDERDSFETGDLVQMTREGLKKLKDATSRFIAYTYKARVLKVVDGDTLRVLIDLGYDTHIRQYLRLRGLNAPELRTEYGKEAKTFLEERLSKMPYITLTSSRSDKYDRYLADVFYIKEGNDIFLNGELLDAELAHPV